MSSGSKTGLVQKRWPKEKSAHEVLQEREQRNAKAKTNVLLRNEELRQKKAATADPWEEPGRAFKLLQMTKMEEEPKPKPTQKEYGEWGTEHWVNGQPPEEEQAEKMDDAEPEQEDVAKEEAEDEDLVEAAVEDDAEGAEPAEPGQELEEEEEDAGGADGQAEAPAKGHGKGKWKKGGGKVARKGATSPGGLARAGTPTVAVGSRRVMAKGSSTPTGVSTALVATGLSMETSTRSLASMSVGGKGMHGTPT